MAEMTLRDELSYSINYLQANTKIRPETVRFMRKHLLGDDTIISTPVDEILRVVALKYGVPIKDICGGRRQEEIVWARTAAAKILRNHRGMKLEKIADTLGGMHHSSIIHLLRRHKDFYLKKRMYKDAFKACITQLKLTQSL